MDPTLSSLIELGALGAFIFFAIHLLRTEQEREKARDERWAGLLRDASCQGADSLKEASDVWRESSDNLASALEKLRQQVAYNTAVIVRHDAWSRGKLGNGDDLDVKEVVDGLLNGEIK